MKPSDDIKNVLLRLYESESSSDINTFTQLFSRREGVLVIGTDPAEWWDGYEVISRVHEAQLQELGESVKFQAVKVQAYEEGTTGWCAAYALVLLPNGRKLPIRATAVFHQEDGEWKIVQYHGSIGVPNDEAFGAKYTVK